MRFEKQTFSDQLVTLDDNEFIDCTFERCTLKYGGGKIFLAGSTTLTDVRFMVTEAANRTLTFIRLMLSTQNGAEALKQMIASTTRPPIQ